MEIEERLTKPRKSRGYGEKLIYFLFYVAVTTISFDIFMVFSIGGFTIRAAQLFLLLPVFVGLAISMIRGKMLKPLGFYSLLAWTIFILIFIPNTTYMLRNIGYGFWLVFNLLLIYATVNLFNTYNKMVKLLTIYFYSFFFVAVFGLIQFFMPVFHLGSPLIAQWWTERFPRINGFSYEPSYFATYMLIGWVFSASLLQSGSNFIERRKLKLIFIVETLTMVLSSSRMGWLMMMIWFLQYPAIFAGRFLLGKLNKSLLKIIAAAGVLGIAGLYYIVYKIGLQKIMFLFAGLGIFGTSSHSSSTRITQMLDTLRVFGDSPFIGYSLGGVSAAIGRLHGIQVTTNELAKMYEGMSVFAEVLAASGVIGFCWFAFYILSLIIKPIQIAYSTTNENDDLKKAMAALVYGFIFLLMILQFNQNILRPYLWMHISILSGLYYVLRNEEKKIDYYHN